MGFFSFFKKKHTTSTITNEVAISPKIEVEKRSTLLSNTNTNGLNSLVKGTTVEGDIDSEGDIRIDGTVRGHISCRSKVIVGVNGVIEGKLFCQNATVEGTVRGILNVVDTLTVRSTGNVTGDVVSARLSMEAGASFNVICKMQRDTPIEMPVKGTKDAKFRNQVLVNA
jgi:cytoskeletal protein CcmA (bactofilin family)